MANHHSDGSVIHSVIHLEVEKGRLKNAGREHNLVEGRTEVRVDRLRSHVPFGAIDRLSDARQFPSGFEGVGAEHISQVVIPTNHQAGVIAKTLGMPHFFGETIKFLKSLTAGAFSHPFQLGESISKDDPEVGDHLRHPSRRRRREILFDVEPTQCLTDRTIDHLGGTLPAGLRLRLPP